VLQRQDYHEDYGDWVWKWPQVKEVALGNNPTEEMGENSACVVVSDILFFHPENWRRFPF